MRDPLRQGADDNELREIIGAAVLNFILSIQDALNFISLTSNEFQSNLFYHITLFAAIVGIIGNFTLVLQVRRKKASHAGMFDIAKTANRPMIHIGG